MKKILFAALTATVLFASCTKKNGTEGPGNGGAVEGTDTYATFNMKIDTRAYSNEGHNPDATSDGNDKLFAGAKLLIFDVTSGVLEAKEEMTSGTSTFLVKSGTKKVFFLTNTDDLSAFNTAYATLTVGSTTTTDFYALQFDAGVPNTSFSVAPLFTQASVGTKGLPASNSNAENYIFVAGVTKEQAEAAGGPNKFTFALQYMGAKAQLLIKPTVSLSGNAAGASVDVSDSYYALKNIARKTNYVQNVVAGVAQSYYWGKYSAPSALPPATEFESAATLSNAVLTAKTGTTTNDGTKYFYITENNDVQNKLLRGQSTYYALKLKFYPGNVVCTTTWDAIGGAVAHDTKPLTDNTVFPTGSKNYIFTLKTIGNIPAGMYFKDLAALQQAVGVAKYQALWTQSGTQVSDAASIVTDAGGSDSAYASFTNAESFYRLDLGKTTGTTTEYGVLRGYAYTAEITRITGPGVPTEDELDDDPDLPVLPLTYFEATITAANWVYANQTGEL